MDSRWWLKDSVIDTWFAMGARVLKTEAAPQSLRPPSLREAIYAWALAQRPSETMTTPETVESYVNGLELGAMSALRDAWERRHGEKEARN